MKKQTPKPWEQQEGEKLQAFRYFVLYRDMQTRSLSKLGALLGMKSIRSIEKYSAKYKWRERSQAWDSELDQKIRAKTTKDLGGMHQRHIQLGMGMQTAVAKELSALVHKVEKAASEARSKAEASGQDPAKSFHEPVLSVNEIVRLSEHGVNMERLSRGQPTEHVRTEDNVDLSSLTAAQVKELKKLHAQLGKK